MKKIIRYAGALLLAAGFVACSEWTVPERETFENQENLEKYIPLLEAESEADRIAFHDLAVVGTALGHVQTLIRTFLQPGRREHMPARTAFHDHRQRNAYLRIAELRNVPLVGIANVSEHQFVHVDVTLSGLCLRQRSRNRHQQ